MKKEAFKRTIIEIAKILIFGVCIVGGVLLFFHVPYWFLEGFGLMEKWQHIDDTVIYSIFFIVCVILAMTIRFVYFIYKNNLEELKGKEENGLVHQIVSEANCQDVMKEVQNMSYGEKQKQEIATIKERTITLNLSDADCERLAKKAGMAGLTVGKLLESFIGDLVDGTYTNGSDERMYAGQWYDRCGFGMFSENTLLNYFLWMGYDVEGFLYLLDNIESGKADLEEYETNPEKYDEEEIGYLKTDMEDWKEEYHDTIDEFVKKHPDADLEKEIEGCRKWLADFERLKGEE